MWHDLIESVYMASFRRLFVSYYVVSSFEYGVYDSKLFNSTKEKQVKVKTPVTCSALYSLNNSHDENSTAWRGNNISRPQRFDFAHFREEQDK